MNTIKLYGFVNAIMMAIFGFCSSSVMLQQYKAASPEMFIIISITGLFMIAGIQALLTMKAVTAVTTRYTTTFLLLDAIAYSSIDLYAAHTGDLQTRWLLNTVVLGVTACITGAAWETIKEKIGDGQKHQSFLNSTQALGSGVGLLVALLCSVWLSYRIGTKEAANLWFFL